VEKIRELLPARDVGTHKSFEDPPVVRHPQMQKFVCDDKVLEAAVLVSEVISKSESALR